MFTVQRVMLLLSSVCLFFLFLAFLSHSLPPHFFSHLSSFLLCLPSSIIFVSLFLLPSLLPLLGGNISQWIQTLFMPLTISQWIHFNWIVLKCCPSICTKQPVMANEKHVFRFFFSNVLKIWNWNLKCREVFTHFAVILQIVGRWVLFHLIRKTSFDWGGDEKPHYICCPSLQISVSMDIAGWTF